MLEKMEVLEKMEMLEKMEVLEKMETLEIMEMLGINVIDGKTGDFKGIGEILEEMHGKNVEIMQIYKNYFESLNDICEG